MAAVAGAHHRLNSFRRQTRTRSRPGFDARAIATLRKPPRRSTLAPGHRRRAEPSKGQQKLRGASRSDENQTKQILAVDPAKLRKYAASPTWVPGDASGAAAILASAPSPTTAGTSGVGAKRVRRRGGRGATRAMGTAPRGGGLPPSTTAGCRGAAGFGSAADAAAPGCARACERKQLACVM